MENNKSNNTTTKKKVFVAMSGGVDSSVAALLLKNCGYDVTGIFARCFNVDGCAERDSEDARRVADKLGISFYVFDFEEKYKERVVEYMIKEYEAGRTPNPDVMCNKEIKFGLFLDKALESGADYLATGHYVRLQKKVLNSKSQTIYKLYRAKDKNKDQSYFLWTLIQKQLKYCIFPLSDYLKSEVRELAREADLPVADKKDSQGICFLGQISLPDFLETYLPPKEGDVITVKGEKVGVHKGIQFYTIGQRHGLDLRHKNKNLGIKREVETKPYYVAEKDRDSNTLVVAEEDNKILYKNKVVLDGVNIVTGELKTPMTVRARIRYRQPLFNALLKNDNSGKWVLEFEKPQKFVAPGQSAVFYSSNGAMLGGGTIE